MIVATSTFPSQKTKYNTGLQEFPETFSALPCFDFTLGSEKKAGLFPNFTSKGGKAQKARPWGIGMSAGPGARSLSHIVGMTLGARTAMKSRFFFQHRRAWGIPPRRLEPCPTISKWRQTRAGSHPRAPGRTFTPLIHLWVPEWD